VLAIKVNSNNNNTWYGFGASEHNKYNISIPLTSTKSKGSQWTPDVAQPINWDSSGHAK